MKERPLLFSGPMVRALLAGTKTQTRRVVKTLPITLNRETNSLEVDDENIANGRFAKLVACPYGQPGDGREAPRSEVHGCGTGAYPLGNQQGLVQPAARGACAGCGAVVDSGHRIGGDRLYVREAWAAPHAYDHLPPRLIPQDARIHYAATEDRGGLLWRPSIHMPRWASRITLEITSVRVERLQDISEADAQAEGTTPIPDPCDHVRLACADIGCSGPQPYRTGFRALWRDINGPDSWGANPWVWVLEFRRINSKEIEHAQ